MEYFLDSAQFEAWYWWCKRHYVLLMVIWYSLGLVFCGCAFWLKRTKKINQFIFLVLVGSDIATLLWAANYLAWYEAEAIAIWYVVPILVALVILNLLVFLAGQGGRFARLWIKIPAYVLATLASVVIVGSFVLVEVFPVHVCIYFSH